MRQRKAKISVQPHQTDDSVKETRYSCQLPTMLLWTSQYLVFFF